MTNFLFFIFSSVLIFSSLLVIISKNPIHSVLFLILCFFNAAVIFLFLEAEFLAMILLIIYVGAVAVLFLFVVMMLDIDIVLLRKNFLNYLPIGLFVGLVIFLELFLVIKKSNFTNEFSNSNFQQESNFISNTHSLGNVLYTDYFIMFQLSGIILLISMIGAILLTLRKREGVKRQNIYNQIFRK